MPMFNLLNKTILVTGASSGIGRGCAKSLALQGARCVLAARNRDRLQQTLEECCGSGHELREWDMNNDSIRDSQVDALPELDGLVYCAGVADNQTPIKFLKPDFVDHIIGVNLRAPMLLMASLVKRKKLCKGASTLFITSFSTIHGSPAHSAYMAAKAGLYGFVRGAALDCASRKIRVNAIAPASVNTPLINFSALTEEQRQANEATYPLGRYGEPSDIASAAVYFMSDESSWVTGTQFIMDGGKSL
jgi:NAD(P)-dependent dehydrogenase (short-subunit alcohol dehydrogenase family)